MTHTFKLQFDHVRPGRTDVTAELYCDALLEVNLER